MNGSFVRDNRRRLRDPQSAAQPVHAAVEIERRRWCCLQAAGQAPSQQGKILHKGGIEELTQEELT